MIYSVEDLERNYPVLCGQMKEEAAATALKNERTDAKRVYANQLAESAAKNR